jgi:hypothetical protein
MATWRDADDPRCPECGEPIGATATYCMHCSSDLPMDDSADVSDADDVAYGTGSPGSDPGGRLGAGGDEVTGDGGGFGAWLGDLLNFNRTEYPGGRPGEPETGGTETEKAAGVPADKKASLGLRLPTAIFVAIPVPFLSVIAFLSVVDGAGGLSLLVFGGSYFAAVAWLARRPLPSEVVGDALYLIAALLIGGPILNQTDLFLRRLVFPDSIGVGFDDIVLGLIAYELVIIIPAAFLIILGYGGNAWAARKLDPDDGRSRQSSGPGATAPGDGSASE